jgi:hypothetical protein
MEVRKVAAIISLRQERVKIKPCLVDDKISLHEQRSSKKFYSSSVIGEAGVVSSSKVSIAAVCVLLEDKSAICVCGIRFWSCSGIGTFSEREKSLAHAPN